MKKIVLLLLVSSTFCQISFSQTTVNPGKPIAEIFTDFHYYLNDTSKLTGFGINRAYLGYNYLPEGNFSATVIVNAGAPDDLVQGAKPRRYAFFREASIKYTKDKLNLAFGIAMTRLFDFQQKFWGKRYVASEYQSRFGYGSVADLGFALDYIISDKLKIDFTVMNGQGYSNLQIDGHLKTSFGLNITPVKQLAFRLYGDFMQPLGINQTTLIAFAGFKNEMITIGGEVSYKSNIDLTEGHNAYGLSGTGSIRIAKKTEIFARYDHCTSALIPGESINWNYRMDNDFVVLGVQYTVSPIVRFALDYQGIYPYDRDSKICDGFFVNAHFKF